MSKVEFPEQILGKWIYLKRLQNRNDVTLLLRRSFYFSPESGSETALFISANSFYQVFVNGRFAGAGPRGHQNSGTSYIDFHEIGYYMEPGNNVIAVKVAYNVDPEYGDLEAMPGMWCQIQCGNKTLLCSDESWEVLETGTFSGKMAKVARNGRSGGFLDLRKIPEHWNGLADDEDIAWEHPDWLETPGTPETFMELHPVPAASVGADAMVFSEICSGYVRKYPCFSSVVFPESECSGTLAAVSYIFSDGENVLPLKLFADYPFKFFCNKTRVFDGGYARGQDVELKLTLGWNRLTVFCSGKHSGMGVMMLGKAEHAEMMPVCDMLDSAEKGWCTAVLKKLRFDECSPAVRIEECEKLTPVPANDELLKDNWDYLKCSEMVSCEPRGGISTMKEGDLRLFGLDEIRYGVVKLTVNASEGDIIDIITGTGRGTGIFPRCSNRDDRESAVCICRDGVNEFLSPLPADCRYVMLHLRKSRTGAEITDASFDELNRNFNRECSFNCSDAFFNQLWQCGRNNLARSTSAVVPADGAPGHDLFMLDSFIESVNVAAVFGDSEFITARLRQYAAAQLEDGSIPALNFGNFYQPSLMHLFFFSSWVLFNYRFSFNMVELRNIMPCVDRVRRYMESLLNDEESGINIEAVNLMHPAAGDFFASCRVPVVLNALFCRFMLSASDLYELTGRQAEARLCRRMVRRVSSRIEKEYFDSETGLFADCPIAADRDVDLSLYGNFFAAFAGIKTEECFEIFVNTFFDFDTGDAKTGEAESPYFHYLFLEMLFALEQREWGIMYLRRYWQKRLDAEGGLLKSSAGAEVSPSGIAGGAGAVPNVFLIREIVGVRIAEPAHSLIYFNPAYDVVDHAEAAIPTVNGRIHIKWERQGEGLEVDIYSSHPMKVLPEFPEDMIKNSTFRLSDNVVLVKAARKKGEE